MSGVADFTRAFSRDRDETGAFKFIGNSKAATFVGTAMSKWTTTSATALDNTFQRASKMNADLTGWKMGKVVTLHRAFSSASKFAGTGLGSWDTASVTTMMQTFEWASEMNADLTGWEVGKVVSLVNTFYQASKFTGTGLASWDISKVTNMAGTFIPTTSITSCSKRRIADAWKSNSAFASWSKDWAADACPPLTDATFKQASWGT